MKRSVIIILIFFTGGLVSGEDVNPVLGVKDAEVTGEPWLGLVVAKPDETTSNQLPALPPGIGFVVTSLTKDGPAERAGVRKLDLLWKMDEQMLINEGQLATLLRLARPGDEVVLSVFREGKGLDLKVQLGELKKPSHDSVRTMLGDSVLRGEDGPMRLVNVAAKKATFTNEEGVAEVRRVGDGDAVKITDAEGKILFEGVVRGRPELTDVPRAWRKRVCVLRRGLEHAMSNESAPLRQPRPRIVPPANQGG